MNRGQLRSALTSRLGIPSAGDSLLDSTTLNDIIGFALRDLSSEADWPWLLTTASLSFTGADATAPTTLVKARELAIGTQPQRARFVPLGEFMDAQASRVECVWTIIGTTVRLTPTPSTAPTATLYFVRGEPTLANDSAEPLCPDAHHQIVLARASYHANTRRNRFEDAARDDNEYQLGVRKMKDAQWVKSGPRRVKAAGSSNWATW